MSEPDKTDNAGRLVVGIALLAVLVCALWTVFTGHVCQWVPVLAGVAVMMGVMKILSR